MKKTNEDTDRQGSLGRGGNSEVTYLSYHSPLSRWWAPRWCSHRRSEYAPLRWMCPWKWKKWYTYSSCMHINRKKQNPTQEHTYIHAFHTHTFTCTNTRTHTQTIKTFSLIKLPTRSDLEKVTNMILPNFFYLSDPDNNETSVHYIWPFFFFIVLLLSLCSQLNLWGSQFWVRFLHIWQFLNPTIEFITFPLRGWCVVGVFLLLAFTRPGHKCQGLLSPCYGIHECTD